MRLIVVDTYYPAFLDAHYAARPGLEDASYTEQLASLLERGFATGDAFAAELTALGHDAQIVIANCAPLQLAWSREHRAARRARALAVLPTRVGLRARSELPRQVTLSQIADCDPDVVYLHDLWFLSAKDLDDLRAAGRLVVGQIASEPPPPDILRRFDLLVTSFPHYVARFADLGVDAVYQPLAFDARLATELADETPAHDVVFVGALNPVTHAAGTAMLEHAAAQLPLEVWGYGVDLLAADSPLRSAWRGEAWGLEMLRVLARSRIVVNRHIDAAEGHANNMRLYEATGAGALLLTDEAANLPELFTPGREVVTYRDRAELVERARHYLLHEDERATIAAAGRARTLRDHTYAQRLAELAALLEARLG